MKTTYGAILVSVMVALMLFTALPCRAMEKNEENIWREDNPGQRRGGRPELTNEVIERIMARLEKRSEEHTSELQSH